MLNQQRDRLTLSGKTYTVSDIVKEKDEFIRIEATDFYFALNELSRDASHLVRTAVARKKFCHDRLAYDKNWRVRATVAQHCDDKEVIDVLAKDSNDFVRYIIAKRGFASELLMHDQDEEVAALAKHNLQNNEAA